MKRNYLIGFRQIEFAETGKVPTQIHIVPVGSFNHEIYGAFTIDDAALDDIIKNFNNEENDLVIDFEHQSISGEKAPAAGWIKKLTKKSDGIWATKIEWVGDTEDLIENKEYRYISPVLDFNSTDNETGNGIGVRLHSVALTNTPWFDGMQPLAAKDGFSFMASINNAFNNNTEDSMIIKLRKILNLKNDASEDKVLEAVEKLSKDKPEDFSGIFKELGLEEDSKPEDVIAAFKSLKKTAEKPPENEYVPIAKFKAIEASLNTLQKELADNKATAAVESALSAGKITAAQKEWAHEYALKDMNGFKMFVEKSPVIVPMSQSEQGGAEKESETSKFSELVGKEIQANKELSYSEAARIVAKKNPELASEVVSLAQFNARYAGLDLGR